MNTLQDLRATLDTHAGAVHDDPVSARVAAVRGRARRVRRQRAGAVVAGAVAAVVGVVAVPMLLDPTPPVPAERLLAGQVAPAELTSLGYTYRFAEGVESGERAATVRLRASSEPRLITWAADADEVRLASPYATDRGSTRTAFDDFVLVRPEESGRWALRAGGADAALAVYELTDDLPAGVTEEGLTFRERVGSERLLDATVGEQGQAEITLEATVPESRRMRVAEFCDGVPQGENLWVNMSIDGDGALASGGCSQDRFDPADGDSTWLDSRHLGRPGSTVEVRMWISRGFRGEPLSMDDAQLGLGLYERPEPAAVVAGWDMPAVREYEGHRWQFVEVVTSEPGEDVLEVRNDGEDVVLAIGSYGRVGQATVTFRHGRGEGLDRATGGGGSDLDALLEPGGAPATMRVRGGLPERGEMGFALYERLD